jgi:phenylalanyl-tRNA synthetase beta chain
MPTISVDQKILEKLVTAHGHTHSVEQIAEHLPLLGTDIDRCDEESLDIEIFPNRPDLLSGETLSRAIRNFIHHQPAEPDVNVLNGNITMYVEPELAQIRPIILGAVVRDVDVKSLDTEPDEFIKSLMDHQEKLHFALGRGRKRASIGVHDLSKLTPPFTVKAVH